MLFGVTEVTGKNSILPLSQFGEGRGSKDNDKGKESDTSCEGY